jgi:hypothetical protein
MRVPGGISWRNARQATETGIRESPELSVPELYSFVVSTKTLSVPVLSGTWVVSTKTLSVPVLSGT